MITHETIKFTLNQPQVLTLADPTGDLDGPNVLYPTSDGRILSLPRHVALKLNNLWPTPDEEISICRYLQTGQLHAEWVVALTPQGEQSRALKEAALKEEEEDRAFANGLPVPDDYTARLLETPKTPGRVVCRAKQDHPQQEESVLSPHCKGKRTPGAPSKRVSYKTALREITQAVTGILREAGEQWSDAAKQDYCSTAFIAAAKTGQIVFDFMDDSSEPEASC